MMMMMMMIRINHISHKNVLRFSVNIYKFSVRDLKRLVVVSNYLSCYTEGSCRPALKMLGKSNFHKCLFIR